MTSGTDKLITQWNVFHISADSLTPWGGPGSQRVVANWKTLLIRRFQNYILNYLEQYVVFFCWCFFSHGKREKKNEGFQVVRRCVGSRGESWQRNDRQQMPFPMAECKPDCSTYFLPPVLVNIILLLWKLDYLCNLGFLNM